MSKVYERLDERLKAWIEEQRMFFVATAPREGGHINLSPKGLDGFRVIGGTAVCYLDFAGSGAETIAHVRENGRIVIMMCAFEGPPLILRMQGTGRPIFPGDPEWAEHAALFSGHDMAGARCIIRADLDRIADSCGWGVPLYSHMGGRSQMQAWCASKRPEGIRAYVADRNAVSIDGLPAVAPEEASHAWPDGE